ncbi:11460_t:CDS:1 [Funneliformis mosseae]|uniref:11460_t:CDS:1 n=1 Tax=Funneliformis mosseae TaxID=27381 RepID=A0A9N8YQ89_FUNMO|nr:11460_t:CDS:1 [Funneliformis mosseae]
MSSSIPNECLSMILELFDPKDLRSCILVDRLWFEISVRFLWIKIYNHRTFLACLPIESKRMLRENGITFRPPTSNPLLFNYVKFIKEINEKTILLGYPKILQQQFSANQKMLIAQESFKLIMKHASLKTLSVQNGVPFLEPNVPYITFPGADVCLQKLCEFFGDSSIKSEYCSRLADFCKGIQKFNLQLDEDVNEGLDKLISVQRNLKDLEILFNKRCTNFGPPLMNLANSLIKLNINGCLYCPNFSFINSFTKLRELTISLSMDHENLKPLQDVTLPQLKILSFQYARLPRDYLSKFLENNGRNLDELSCDYSLNLDVAKFCPNLKILKSIFSKEDDLKAILNNCQELKTLEVHCCELFLDESKILVNLAKFTPRNLSELIITKSSDDNNNEKLFSNLLEDLSWGEEQHTPISIIIRGDKLNIKEQNKQIIENYISLGHIKSYKLAIT